MRKLAYVFYFSIALAPLTAKAADETFTCPSDSDTCSYLVNTGETPPVSGGGGHTADKSALIVAPGAKYLANGRTETKSQNGIHPQCEIESREGGQTRKVSGVSVTFYKRYIVRARAETGSGLGNEGKTAHMQCAFIGELVDLPQ